MKLKNKIIGLLLVFCLVAGLMPTAAFAAGTGKAIQLGASNISGYDSTPECAVTKLMFLLGHGLPNKEIRYKMNSCLIGEITKP